MTTTNRWLIVLGGVLMNLSLGAIYGWSLFVPALRSDLTLTAQQTSLVFAIAIGVFAVSFLIGGRIQDKKGPYVVSMTGSILYSLGFLLTSQVSSLQGLYWAFGLVVGVGAGLGYVTPIAVVSKWFPDRRGLVVGISVGAFGAGSAILGQFAPGWIASAGWQNVMQWLGIGYFVATMIGAQLLKNPPAGWKPEGWTPAASSPAKSSGLDFAPSEIIKTPHFWRLWISYALGASAGLMVISQLVPYAMSAIPGTTAAIAGTAVIVGAIGSALGRILSGWLSDHIGRIKTLSMMIMLSAISLPLLGRIDTLLMLWPLLFVVYYCYGTLLSVFASTTADFFGSKNVGANYGLVFLSWGVAGSLGPILAGRLYDQLGSYTRAFDILAVLLVVAFITLVTLKPPQKITS
ncbi:MAG: hypothetical protein A3F68_02715 [Acidobacteria bacterium RIFCSPLOWO2_12_FULL_54_10]|nr:MAG: hypothetical protein A3F68_02715 [Acidobacteria bacterium RIFCSPLOWO2_12_FULL_54_10]